MRRVLIVSPHFPPVNAPDMQRVRLALPHLPACGWEPTVLAVSPESVEGPVIEDLLTRTCPASVPVIRVRGVSPRLTRPLGFGSLWLRCGRALRRAGDALLAREKFDLVFFSTTQFDAFTLGPRWRRRFGVPYVLDYQDPWVNDYYRETGVRPPGGPLRFLVSQITARRREPAVLRAASGVVAVSDAYGPALARRYPWFSPGAVRSLPFGASPGDLDLARSHRPAPPLVPFGDGGFHHVYAGRCGDDMDAALTLLFRAFKRYLASHPDEASRHRFHFIGTDYAPPPLGRLHALPVAEREGVGAFVAEHCRRVPYFDALHYLTRADALVLLGSDDPGYSASKIAPCLFARRPLLTLAHENSRMLSAALAQGIATTYAFNASTPPDTLARRIHDEWFAGGGCREIPAGDPAALAPLTAAGTTRLLAAVFDDAVRAPLPT